MAADADPAAVPPNTKPTVCVPAPPKPNLDVVILVVFDQDDPLYSSVAVPTSVALAPPAAKAAVCIPIPAKYLLAVFKLPPDVHEVPSYSSVIAT